MPPFLPHVAAPVAGPGRLVANRPLDLRAVDAIGFDLDHTLALYDDDAVNALAMAEAQELLVDHRGYARDDVAVRPDADDAAAGRALAIGLSSGHVIKLDAARRVRVARRAGAWLDARELVRAYPEAVPVGDAVAHPLSSPFDVPTLWLFDAIARARADGVAGRAFDAPRACRDVREMLDLSHTRGRLKLQLARDLGRYVAPVPGLAESLTRWRRAGKKLFVVTNSERTFAAQVLDLAVGPEWRALFAVVVTSASKPGFFARAAGGRHSLEASTPTIEGARADAVETILGAGGARVLYAGDNLRSDICPARDFGWSTVHVAAELSAGSAAPGPWGSPFSAGGAASWFARAVEESADIACDRVDRLLDRGPDAVFSVAS